MPTKFPKQKSPAKWPTATSSELIAESWEVAKKETRKEIADDPEKARSALVSAGILTSSGKLSKRFRGK